MFQALSFDQTTPDIPSPDADNTIEILATETLKHGDPRASSPDFIKAKLKEIHGLCQKNTFGRLLKSEVDNNENILSGHFVLTFMVRTK